VVALLATVAVPTVSPAPSAAGEADPVVRWNRVVLDAVRRSTMPPPAVARALAVVNTCMFDAWAAYDDLAVPTRPTGVRRPAAERTTGNQVVAVSTAAHLAARDLFPADAGAFDAALAAQGLDPQTVAATPGSAGAAGRAACQAVLDFRHGDGSNQLGDMPGSSGAPYSDYTNYRPVNDPDTLRDPNRWQPLRTVKPSGEMTVQQFALPHWPRVRPFSLRSGSQLRSTAPPARYGSSDYAQQADALLMMSARLSDETKAVAEYWADGPGTETPPGHWVLIATFCSERDGMTLDENVVMFFALANAVFDAGIVSWDNKVAYDYVRPISAIRHLYRGRPVAAWGGPGEGTRTIDGSGWRPYLATPPFAEYTSGHSTFSAAAAEVLRLQTGSDRFGGSAIVGAGTSRVEPGVSPTRDVTLTWPTFSAAAAEAGVSRQYGGIHFPQADHAGQESGRAVARLVWARVQAHVHGLP
jgi:hypothetical protein